jgi:hypothetical protein
MYGILTEIGRQKEKQVFSRSPKNKNPTFECAHPVAWKDFLDSHTRRYPDFPSDDREGPRAACGYARAAGGRPGREDDGGRARPLVRPRNTTGGVCHKSSRRTEDGRTEAAPARRRYAPPEGSRPVANSQLATRS